MPIERPVYSIEAKGMPLECKHIWPNSVLFCSVYCQSARLRHALTVVGVHMNSVRRIPSLILGIDRVVAVCACDRNLAA